jgi:hypothetical protein
MQGTLHMKTQVTIFKRTELAEPYGVSEKLFSCTQTEKSLQQNQLQQRDAKERTMHKEENNLKRTKTIERLKSSFARQDRWRRAAPTHQTVWGSNPPMKSTVIYTRQRLIIWSE